MDVSFSAMLQRKAYANNFLSNKYFISDTDRSLISVQFLNSIQYKNSVSGVTKCSHLFS